MNPFAIGSLISGIVCLELGIFALYRNPKGAVHRIFFLFGLSLCVWSFSEFIYRTIPNRETARIWANVQAIGWCFMGPLFVHFMLIFSERTKVLKNKLIYLIYLPAVIFLYLPYTTELIFSHEGIKMYWGYSFPPGDFAWIYMLYYLTCFLSGLYFDFRFWQRTTLERKKKQAQIIFMSVMVALTVGTITSIILPLKNILVPEMGATFTMVPAAGVAYAMTKYKLMIVTPAVVPDSLSLVDPEGNMVAINPATEKLLGYNEDELIGKPAGILFEEEVSIFKGTRLKKLIEEGSVRNYDMKYKTKKGEVIPVSFSGSVMRDKGGEIVGIVGIARDMRDIKRLEAQVVQSGKMAAIGQFAAGVAHEIRNPLTAITMNTAFLLDELKDNGNALKKLKTIEKEADRSSEIVRSLLAFSRPSKEENVLADINSLIEETLVPFKHQISLANVEIIREFASDLPKLAINTGEMSQVFLNLINNAVEAMPDGGKLFIKTCTQKIAEKGRRGTDILKLGQDIVSIEFKDTGKGISEGGMKRLFTPFYTTKETGKGVGLGLFISHGIIEKHRGEIEVESKVGNGTTFRVKLPIAD